ncbi:MAG: phosphoribosylformylglycinamidine synthase I [Anaerolineales bacterium]
MKPTALILQAHGTNRDLDVAEALTQAGAEPVFAPLNDLRAGKKRFADYNMLVVPGGFSYADALGAGKLLALDLKSYFADEISAFVASGKPVIGICNGFQALVKAGILPGNPHKSAGETPKATLTFNAQGHFECRWVHLQPISQTCIWTQGLEEQMTCPVAHGEGNFQVSHAALLNTLAAQDQIALTYVYPDGAPANGDYPFNPNGSALDIAGICNPAGNVLGLMPHPENHIYPWQHPLHTRGQGGGLGLVLFENGVRYAQGV